MLGTMTLLGRWRALRALRGAGGVRRKVAGPPRGPAKGCDASLGPATGLHISFTSARGAAAALACGDTTAQPAA